MRAGFPGGSSSELGAGSSAAATNSVTNYEWNNADFLPHWRPNNLPQTFSIGYRQATGMGFVSVLNSSGSALTASFANAGSPLGANAVWTLPPASFFATAVPTVLATSVSLENMTFLPGVQILSGSLPVSLGASTTLFGGTVTNTISAPIVFTPTSGGDWTITGTLRFNGLLPLGGTAFGDQLRIGFGAFGSDTASPEASSVFLIGAGLIALGYVRLSRTRRAAPAKQS